MKPTNHEERAVNAASWGRDLFDRMPMGIIVWRLDDLVNDRSFLLLAANPAASAHVGFPLHHEIGRRVSDIAPELFETPFPAKLRDVVATKTAHDFGPVRYKNPYILENIFSVRAFPLADQCVGICFEPVGANKQIAKELEDFASIASHDLQEPLRKITNYSQILSQRYRHQLDADAGKFLDYLSDATSRMQQLIRNVLNYSRLGRGDVPQQATELMPIIKQVLNDLELTILQTGATIVCDALPTVTANPFQMKQVWQNLIGNALKFQRPNEPVHIHITAVRQNDHWLFSVRDTGIGVDSKNAQSIFAPFKRLHSRSEFPGTGMGLAICKKIVEQHRGRIGVTSETEQGSTFWFTLPATQNARIEEAVTP